MFMAIVKAFSWFCGRNESSIWTIVELYQTLLFGVWLLRFLLWPVLHHSILELVCFPVSWASTHLFLQIYILLGGCLIKWLDSLDPFIYIFLSGVRDIDQVCVLNFCWILMDLWASQVNHSQCCLPLSLRKWSTQSNSSGWTVECKSWNCFVSLCLLVAIFEMLQEVKLLDREHLICKKKLKETVLLKSSAWSSWFVITTKIPGKLMILEFD